MKIICQNCNKKGCYEKSPASYRDKVHGIGTTVWRQLICDKCNYVADEWENARYNWENPHYGEEDLSAVGKEIENSQLIKLDNNPIYHEKVIYSDEQMAGFISAEEFFKQANQTEKSNER